MQASRLRVVWILCALMMMGGPVCAQVAGSETLVVEGLGRGLAPLGGLWRFHVGDDGAWKDPGLDDSGWERIEVNHAWGAQGHFGYAGFGWYRRRIDFKDVAGVKRRLALLMAPAYGPYEVFWNGVLVGRNGRMPPEPSTEFREPPHSFGLGSGGAGVLAVRYWTPPLTFTSYGDDGGIWRTPMAGPADAVAAQIDAMDHAWLRDRQFYFFLNVLYGLLGIAGLAGWLKNRELKLLLWVSLFAFSQPLHVLLFNARMPLPAKFCYGLDLQATALKMAALWYMLLYLLELDGRARLRLWMRRLAWGAALFATLDCVVTWAMWTSDHLVLLQVIDALLAVPLGLVEAFPLVLVGFAVRKKLPLASWLVAGSALLLEMIGAVAITSLQGQRFTNWHGVYTALRVRIFTVRGNYFDPQNVASILLLMAIFYALYVYLGHQSTRRNALEQEFRSAQEVQQILIPETPVQLPGFAVTSAYRPALEVGGDFFQVMPMEDGAALIVVGDVSGKGLKAAMTVSMAIGAMRSIVDTTGTPGELLVRMNRRLHGRMQNGFATCLAVRLEADGRCMMANAGHLSPFVNGTEVELPGALPLGLVAVAQFEEVEVRLGVGDRLTMYTDGLLEARNASGELYGFERVQELIATEPDALAATEAAVAFGQDDDITVLTVTRLGAGVEAAARVVTPVLVAV